MEQKLEKQVKLTYANLTPWQKLQVSRHPQRPHCLDYVHALIEDFTPLCGDRLFGDDEAMIGGIGRFKNISVVVIGQEKGSDLETRMKHNFGMAKPEGYRKAQRLMDMADKFNMPVIAFVDTDGAFPGIDAEAPRCALLSNGTYCLAVSEAGQSFARWHALSVCRRGTRADPAAGPVVRLETDDFSGPLLPGTAAGAQWRFTVRAAQFTARHGDVTAVQTLTVPGRANGEVRALTLSLSLIHI